MGLVNWITVVTLILSTDASRWGYEGEDGPIHWRDLFPEACSGRYQSPIDIVPENTIYDPQLKDFAVFYDPPQPGSKFYLHNNGHAVQVDMEGQFYVSNGGLPNIYRTAQFHFHWGHKDHHGSEHTVNGAPAAIEMHIVNWNSDRFSSIAEAATERQGLAVLGILFEVSEYDNPVLEPIVQIMMDIRDPDAKIRAELPAVSMREFLPRAPWMYYRYDGSLTTPGCFESVLWTVFREKQTISKRQLRVFRQVLRPKHHKHHRYRRSASHEQSMVRSVMEEIGIEDNAGERSRFRRNLEAKMETKMVAETNPQVGKEAPVAEISNEMTKTEHVATQEGGNQTGNAQDAGHGHTDMTSSAGKEGGHAPVDVKLATMEETVRQMLVNNFRPVQPLNGRVVYRSFAFLNEPVGTSRGGPEYVRVQQSKQEGEYTRGSSATVITFSTSLVSICLLFVFGH